MGLPEAGRSKAPLAEVVEREVTGLLERADRKTLRDDDRLDNEIVYPETLNPRTHIWLYQQFINWFSRVELKPGPPGPPGATGETGDAASISADPGNLIREGSDGKMFARMEWTGIPNW
jgi:hypothetical protein